MQYTTMKMCTIQLNSRSMAILMCQRDTRRILEYLKSHRICILLKGILIQRENSPLCVRTQIINL